MSSLTLKEAGTIVDVALAKGRELNLQPLCVVVLDAGGHQKALKREDGASILRPQVAHGKAWGALGMGQSSRALSDRLNGRPTFLTALAVMSGGNVVPVPGGVLIRKDGEIVGSVGISGDTSDNDEACAVAGIQAAGLEAVI